MNGSSSFAQQGLALCLFSLYSLLFWQGLQLCEPRQGKGKQTSKGTPAVTKEATARIS